MCKASVYAHKWVDVAEGQLYRVGMPRSGHPALHAIGVDPRDCVACPQTGQRLTVFGVPLAVREAYNVPSVIRALFVQTASTACDQLNVTNLAGRTSYIPLSFFVDQDVTLYCGELPEETQVLPESTEVRSDEVAQIMEEALRSAAVLKDERELTAV